MSYILDALKKSERERALGNIPTLATTGQDEKKRVPLSWFVAALAVFTAAAAGFGISSYWQTPEPAAAERDSTKIVAWEASSRSAAKQVEPESAAEAAPAVLQPAVERAQVPEVAAGFQDPVMFAELDPSLRSRLPVLSVDVLSYSKKPSRRFVMINQNIYKQGENIGNGIAIDDIRESAVVLSFENVRFLLFP